MGLFAIQQLTVFGTSSLLDVSFSSESAFENKDARKRTRTSVVQVVPLLQVSNSEFARPCFRVKVVTSGS